MTEDPKTNKPIVRSCPENPPPEGFEFQDAAGRPFLVKQYSGGDWWLHFKHPDGQWVTQRKVASDDGLKHFWRLGWMQELVMKLTDAIEEGE